MSPTAAFSLTRSALRFLFDSSFPAERRGCDLWRRVSRRIPRPKGTGSSLVFFFNLLVASMVVVILAHNGVLFLMAWEVMALSSFFLVTFEDEKESTRQAGWIYLRCESRRHSVSPCAVRPARPIERITRFQSLLGILGSRTSFRDGAVWIWNQGWFCAAARLVTRVVAHPAAPSHVSAVMSAVMIKTGIYGLLRVMMLLGAPEIWWGWVLCGVGLTSGMVGVLLALAQKDLKRLLAYSSVENGGIIALRLRCGLDRTFRGETRSCSSWLCWSVPARPQPLAL